MWKHLTVCRIEESPRKVKRSAAGTLTRADMVINPNLEQVAERAKETGR